VIDLKTNAVIDKPIQVGSVPNGPTTNKAYVTSSMSGTVDIIDLKTNTFIGKLSQIGTQPTAVV